MDPEPDIDYFLNGSWSPSSIVVLFKAAWSDKDKTLQRRKSALKEASVVLTNASDEYKKRQQAQAGRRHDSIKPEDYQSSKGFVGTPWALLSNRPRSTRQDFFLNLQAPRPSG